MGPIDWNEIAGQLITGAGQIIISAITGFIAAWITFDFATKRDVLSRRAEVQADLDKSRHKRIEDVVEGIWKRTRLAREKSSAVTAMIKQYPDFSRLTEEETAEIIQSSRLSDAEKSRFFGTGDRNTFYADRIFWHDISDARTALYDLQAYYLDNKIFISKMFSDAVSNLLAAYNEALITYEVWKQAPDAQLMKRAREETKIANEKGEQVEVLARDELESLRTSAKVGA